MNIQRLKYAKQVFHKNRNPTLTLHLDCAMHSPSASLSREKGKAKRSFARDEGKLAKNGSSAFLMKALVCEAS